MKIKTTLFSVVAAGLMAAMLPGVPSRAEGAVSAKDSVIADGVYIGDIDVSGMTEEEAKEAVDEYVADIEQEEIEIEANGESVSVTLAELGLQWTNRDTAEEAVTLGKTGNIIKRYKDLTALQHENHIYDMELTLDDQKLSDFIEEEVSAFDQEVVEPSLERVNGKFQITEGASGILVNVEETQTAVKEAVQNAENYRNLKVEAVCEVTEPEHDASELEMVQDVLGSYTTTYNSGNVGRTQSLELSTSRLNGVLIYPGETISVSTLMGPRTIEGGYSSAEGYVGTRTEDMIGAGICQTATTLYCASLYSELDVVERRNHTKIVNYVPYSMDATIYAGDDYANPNTDLKLKNGFDYPVYIEASASGGRCTFTIYGYDENPEREVEFIPTTLEETYPTEVTYIEDPSQPVGYSVKTQSAYPRVVATLTKVVTVNGVETERTVLHTDKYQMAQEEWVIGTAGQEETQPTDESQATDGSQPADGSQPTDGSQSTGETTQSAETQPTETQPTETQPAETQPTDGAQQ